MRARNGGLSIGSGAVVVPKTIMTDENAAGHTNTASGPWDGSYQHALNAMKNGLMVARSGWNGKGMFVFKTVGNTVAKDFIPKFASLPQSVKTFLETKGEDVVFNDSFTIYNAQGQMQPGWHASQADTLAMDWEIVY